MFVRRISLLMLNCWCRGSQIILSASAASVTVAKDSSAGAGGGGSPPRLPSSSKKAPAAGCEELDLQTRVQQLEDRWQELNTLPTNSEMFRRLHKFREIEEGIAPGEPGSNVGSNVDNQMQPQAPVGVPQGLNRTCHPMSELWHSMQLLNQVETNTEGITRVRTSTFSVMAMFRNLFRHMARYKCYLLTYLLTYLLVEPD